MTKEEALNILVKDVDTNKISDGYHTFGELYEHRIVLYMALCKSLHDNMSFRATIWKSKKHSDGSEWDGWFLLGIKYIKGDQITYHLPNKYWDECWFATEKEQAPEFDGHTSSDVLERLKNI